MSAWASHVWYDTTFLVTHLVTTLGMSLRTEGGDHVPAAGPVLVLANHGSILDPVLVGLASRRHLHYLARKTLFKNPIFGSLIRSLNAVPIDHEGVGKEGLKKVLELLGQDRAVVVFPEGTRTDDGTMGPFRPGVALLVARARPPIVPVGIAGAFDAWPYWKPLPKLSPLFLPPQRWSIAVSVGKPLDGNHYADLPRTQLLEELFSQVRDQKVRAEKLRRKL
jgi:1-acyl-sn-glycerol-3-phosphate acyltransferase